MCEWESRQKLQDKATALHLYLTGICQKPRDCWISSDPFGIKKDIKYHKSHIPQFVIVIT